MKNLFTFIILSLICVAVKAQNADTTVNFTLLPTANFVCAEDPEKDFMVIPFEGKSSQEIYQMIMTNASLVVNNPDKQVSGVEYSVVKVNIKQHLLTDVVMMLPLSCTGTVFYEFQIKDGRVKVNAPYVGSPCHYGTSDKTCYFSSVVKGYFKKGILKEKKADEFNQFIAKTNLIINTILGLAEAPAEEDW